MLLIDFLYKENVKIQNKIVVSFGFIIVCVLVLLCILDQNKIIDLFVGEIVMFCCQVMGIFLFQVKWYKEIIDSGEIICEGRYVIIYYYYCKY